jgi:predicted RNase H-like nuclease (RuvC/YqgF family)
MSAIPTRPGLLARFWRWFMDAYHDSAERRAIRFRLCSLEHLDNSLRAEVDELKPRQFSGNAMEAAAVAQRIKSLSRELDDNRSEMKNLHRRLRLLGE